MENVAPRENPPAPLAPETAKESEPAKEKEQAGAAPSAERAPSVEAPKAAAAEARPADKAAAVETRDPDLMRVERILEKNLLETYLALPPASRANFKTAGEATAAALRALLDKRSVRPRLVLGPIRKWLKTIPDVNPYFLDQEAKIKTDAVLRFMAEKKEQTLE